MTTAVEPVRETFLDDVRAEAARVLAHADRRADAKRAETDERGQALVAEAREAGRATAALAGAHEHVEARRRARAAVLAARRELYDELHRQARAAARALRGRPGYDALLERLSAAARAQLGEDAVVEVDPPDAGGIRARAGARSVDYTLGALTDRCLERLGGEVERLWR